MSGESEQNTDWRRKHLFCNTVKVIIDDLAAFGAPVMLFSGGEPLVREDLVELAKYATSKGMRAVISTNGTLITKAKARELKDVGLSYVGHFLIAELFT